MRPHLRVVRTEPVTPELSVIVAVPPEIRAQAENIRIGLARALLPLSTDRSTGIALDRSRAELYRLATEMQRLARRLP